MTELLSVNRLKTQFTVDRNTVITAVDEVSFTMGEGETLAIVGESGISPEARRCPASIARTPAFPG